MNANCFKIVKEIDFCYGHRLRDYDGKCQYLHGHNGRLEIEISSNSLDHRGMVMDFQDIKNTAKAWIDENLDHKMLLRKDDPLIATLNTLKEPYFTMETNPTAEEIARLIFNVLIERHIPVTKVTLWETDQSSASYQATQKAQ